MKRRPWAEVPLDLGPTDLALIPPPAAPLEEWVADRTPAPVPSLFDQEPLP